MNETPRANRIHIAIFGRTNVGKSSFINALVGQQVSIVSDKSGTTTDPVYKNTEIHPIGACVLIDTAGFDDESILGQDRIKATLKVIDKTDIAIILFAESDISKEKEWASLLKKNKIPTLAFINKMDTVDCETLSQKIEKEIELTPIPISASNRQNIEIAREKIIEIAGTERERTICGHLVENNDLVMLVMPQDIQAPKGRLILPQVQTIRDLLDNKCVVISATADNAELALTMLAKPPKLIITDSQVFPFVKKIKPEESILTSFSVLFSKYKGDIDIFVEGAKALAKLKDGDKVLIAEACSHNQQDGDIAREKIPKLLKKNYGDILVEVVSGTDFPEDLSIYSAIIHCGSCMFNRKYVMSRIEKAQEFGIPITNYGLAIAFMNNMMESIVY